MSIFITTFIITWMLDLTTLAEAYILAAGATFCGSSSDEYTVIDNNGLVDW